MCLPKLKFLSGDQFQLPSALEVVVPVITVSILRFTVELFLPVPNISGFRAVIDSPSVGEVMESFELRLT